MASVPKYTPSVAERPAHQAPITVQANADDFGAQVGRGMEGLAQGLQQTSNMLGQLQELEDAAEVKSRINGLAEYQMNAAYGDSGFFTLSGKAAVDGYEKYLADLKTQSGNFRAGLRPSAHGMFDQAVAGRMQTAQLAAIQHRSNEKQRWMIDTSTARQELLAEEAVLNWAKPALMNSALTMGASEVRDQGALLGWDELFTDRKVYEYQSRALANVALQMAQDDPIAATEFLVSNSNKFTPPDGYDLAQKLFPMVQEAAARDAVTMGSMPAISPGTSPADLIMGFEGFSSGAYNDPNLDENGKQVGANVYRAGFGSDTVTRADGSIVAVDPSTIVTREDAKRDLERRLAAEFIPRAIGAVGIDAWAALDGATQAALASVTYNYGSLPNSVARAVIGGNRAAIAAAIDGLASHNGGINANRRRQEAELVRNGMGAGVQFSDRVETLLQAMPADMAVQVREAAANEIAKSQNAEAAARRAVSAAAKDALQLGIITGSVQSEQEILNHPDIDAGDKASLVTSFRSAQNTTAEARAYTVALASGEARALNPYSSDDKSLANKSFEMAMAALPVEQRRAAGFEFVRDTGIVPDEMIAAVRQGLNSVHAPSVGAALEQSAALMEVAPLAVGHLENAKEIEQAAATYTALVDGKGMGLDQAAAYVIEQRKPENIVKADLLKSAWTEAAKGLNVNHVLEAFGDNWMPGGPTAGLTPMQQQAVLSDYLNAAEVAFKGPAQGDVGIARSMALAEMKRTYGVSTVSGQEVVMPFPPELFYPAVGGNHDYIRQMALADARQIEPEAQNVMLSAVPQTTQDVRSGKPPRYQLSYVLPNGVIEAVPGHFVVDTSHLQQLASLDSERRKIEFEIKRQYDTALRSRPHDFERSYIERMSAGLVGPPGPAELVPGYDQFQSQLLDIDLRRNALMGQNGTAGTTVMTREQIDPAAAEQQWLQQQSASFGMLGGGAPR